MTAPRRPADVPGVSASPELLDELRRHHAALPARGVLVGVAGVDMWAAVSDEEVVDHELAALAISHALAERLLAARWCRAVSALEAGATVEQVAAAMGLDDDEVRAGIRSWADSEERANGHWSRLGLTPAAADEVRALVGPGDAP